MAKRRKKRRPREKAATVDYIDAEGNDADPARIAQPRARSPSSARARRPRRRRRRTPGTAARSCSSSGSRCSWEIAGLPLDRPEDAARPLPDGRPGDPAVGAGDDRRAPRALYPGAGRVAVETSRDERSRRCSRTRKATNGFAVDDMRRRSEFYGETLGLGVEIVERGVRLLTSFSWPAAATPSSTLQARLRPGHLHDPQLRGRRHRRGRRRARLARRQLRALRRLRAGREGHRPRPGPADRLVQGPGRQHPLGAAAALADGGGSGGEQLGLLGRELLLGEDALAFSSPSSLSWSIIELAGGRRGGGRAAGGGLLLAACWLLPAAPSARPGGGRRGC